MKAELHVFMNSTLVADESSAIRSARFTPGRELPAPIGSRMSGPPEPALMLSRKEISVALAGNRTALRPRQSTPFARHYTDRPTSICCVSLVAYTRFILTTRNAIQWPT